MTQSYTHSSQFSSALGSKVREEDPAFSDIIAAISEGKYSWACVLILRSAGYNPLHYMPYRTYNRIIKANLNLGKNRSQSSKSASSKSKVSASSVSSSSSIANSRSHTYATSQSTMSRPPLDCQISDLPHLESASESSRNKVKGGWNSASADFSNWWSALLSNH